MKSALIERSFAKIGARARVHAAAQNMVSGVSIDIGRDGEGEFFDIAFDRRAEPELAVVDTQPGIRHLLLLSRESEQKHKFLCGHDERHWFVAAVPERASTSSVKTAMEALKPAAIRDLQDRLKIKSSKRNRRRNDAFVRQGEWFFVPVRGGITLDKRWILRNEPLRRGRGKPHIVEELIRYGGETVYVHPRYPNGLTAWEYEHLLKRDPSMRNRQWQVRRRNPSVFVRGRVRHPDHKTIFLPDWREVMMNTETESAAMRHVAFID